MQTNWTGAYNIKAMQGTLGEALDNKVTHDRAYYTLDRKTSKYNKYMKWHVQYYHEDKSLLASSYFKTRKEAQWDIDKSINGGKRGFPIGNRITYTEYQELPV